MRFEDEGDELIWCEIFEGGSEEVSDFWREGDIFL